MSAKKGGQPKKTEWEKVRIVAWTNWVKVRALKKLDEALSDGDPFWEAKKSFQMRWTVKYLKPITMTDLGAVFLGNREGEKTRTDFSAYRKGENARPKNSVIDAVDKALPETGNFYRFGPYKVPLWVALSGQLTLEDFWQPMMQSSVFDASQWAQSRKLMEEAGLENSPMNLSKIPWQVWLATLTKLLSAENEAIGEASADKVQGHRQFGYATIAIAATHRAIQDDPYSDSLKKQELCRLVEGFAPLWEPLDANFLVGEKPDKDGNIKPNPYPIAGAVGKLTDQLRGIAEACLSLDAEPYPDEA